MSQDLEAMNLVELLDQLRPMATPPPISMLPQTIGWLILLIGFVIISGWAGYLLVQSRKRNAYRRAALAELEQLSDDPAQLANLLRRTALNAFPRSMVAALHGDDWLKFLDRSYGGNGFFTEEGQTLIIAPYRSDTRVSPQLKHLAGQWIRQHRPLPC